MNKALDALVNAGYFRDEVECKMPINILRWLAGEAIRCGVDEHYYALKLGESDLLDIDKIAAFQVAVRCAPKYDLDTRLRAVSGLVPFMGRSEVAIEMVKGIMEHEPVIGLRDLLSANRVVAVAWEIVIVDPSIGLPIYMKALETALALAEDKVPREEKAPI